MLKISPVVEGEKCTAKIITQKVDIMDKIIIITIRMKLKVTLKTVRMNK